MPETTRQEKITFGEVRAAGVRGRLIYFSDCRCSHGTTISGGPDDVRLTDLWPLFTCQVCGHKGADVRPNFSWEEAARCGANDRAPTLSAWTAPSAIVRVGPGCWIVAPIALAAVAVI
jgi:hypothetical protein